MLCGAKLLLEGLSKSPRGIPHDTLAALQAKLDAAAAAIEEAVAARVGLAPADLQSAVLAHGADPTVSQLRDEIAALNVQVEIPLRDFTPVFVRVMTAQADALNALSGEMSSPSNLDACQEAEEQQAMKRALDSNIPLEIFKLNCAIHCRASSQFRQQLQRILQARTQQFIQWGCYAAAQRERSYMQLLGLSPSAPQSQRSPQFSRGF